MLVDYKILIAIGMVAMLWIVIWSKMKKSKEKELRMIAEDKLRDQALNKALANHLYSKSNCEANIESIPYEVDYNQKQLNNTTSNKGRIMLQITECSQLSKRKFMVELKETIKIGRAKENPIVIKSPEVLPIHCEIFAYQNQVFIRDFSGNQTLLKRKKQNVYVDEKGLKLKTGDQVIIGDTALEITIVDKME